jgi:hypothetical protein
MASLAVPLRAANLDQFRFAALLFAVERQVRRERVPRPCGCIPGAPSELADREDGGALLLNSGKHSIAMARFQLRAARIESVAVAGGMELEDADSGRFRGRV